ncbi:hypothetical protein D9M68_402080 [compost metagenome]
MKRTLIPLTALMLAATLAGCDKADHAKPVKVAETPVAEASAPADPCADSALAKALPPESDINGYAFVSRSCGYNSANAVYGKADGSQHLEISLTDTGLPAPAGSEQSGMADNYLETQTKVRDMTRQNVALLQSAREAALKNGTAAEFGGEGYLPRVEKATSGEPLVITVAGADEAAGANLTGLLKERYVLNLLSSDQPFGKDALAASKLLMPFVEKMQLGELR